MGATMTETAPALADADSVQRVAREVAGDQDFVRNFSMIAQDVQTLLHVANLLTDAETAAQLTHALDANLQLWVAIRSAVAAPENELPADIKANLTALAGFVGDTTLGAGQRRLEPQQIEILARINLNVAAGMAEGHRQLLVRRRAYEIWEEEGRPDGKAEAHWLAAERELDDQMKDV